MGLLAGKITPQTTFRDDDIRQKVAWFPGFKDGHANPEWLDALASIREMLTSNGRTLAQGALAWIWGRSRHDPAARFRTVAQVTEMPGRWSSGRSSGPDGRDRPDPGR